MNLPMCRNTLQHVAEICANQVSSRLSSSIFFGNRNFPLAVIGVEVIFTQRGLPYTLKTLLFSAPPDTKEYTVATFLRIIHHCRNPLFVLCPTS